MKALETKLAEFKQDLEKSVQTRNGLNQRIEQLNGAIFALEEVKKAEEKPADETAEESTLKSVK